MKRLTKKVSNDIVENEYVYEPYIALNEPHKSIAQKLGKLEDLMDKYKVKDLEELELMIETYIDERGEY